MTGGFNNCGKITNKEYRWIREKHAIIQSELKKGVVVPKERIEKRLSTMRSNDTFAKMGEKISASLLRVESNGNTVAKNSMTKIVEKRKQDIDEYGKHSFIRAGEKRVKEARKIFDEFGHDKIYKATLKMVETRSIKNVDGESSYTIGAKKGSMTRKSNIESNGKSISENARDKQIHTLRTGVRSDGLTHSEYRKLCSSGSKNGMAVRCNIMNDKHEVMFECDGNIKTVCLENNIPIKIRYTSKDDFLYKDLKGAWKQKCIDKGEYQYYGWYIERI